MTQALILVSNDDGFESRALQLLADSLEALGEVWVVAPDRPRSGVSRMITLHKPLRLRERSTRRFACSGTPTDCVYIALEHVLPRLPDLVVSGINYGANLGVDVTYSGTVAAAFEGLQLGVPGVAASLVHGEGRPDFEEAAAVVTRVSADVLRRGLPERTVLNINVPQSYRRGNGIEVTRLGHRGYKRLVEVRQDPRGYDYCWIGGPALELDDTPGTDGWAVGLGRASVTPICLDLDTRHEIVGGWDFLNDTETTT